MDDARYLELKSLIENGFMQVIAEQRRQADAIAGLRGRMVVSLQWLQSMDQHFVALMHPYEPRKPAA
ncbi:MAG: hypothetical protein H7840_09930 [Alphaproteobacteria bacterium]